MPRKILGHPVQGPAELADLVLRRGSDQRPAKVPVRYGRREIDRLTKRDRDRAGDRRRDDEGEQRGEDHAEDRDVLDRSECGVHLRTALLRERDGDVAEPLDRGTRAQRAPSPDSRLEELDHLERRWGVRRRRLTQLEADPRDLLFPRAGMLRDRVQAGGLRGIHDQGGRQADRGVEPGLRVAVLVQGGGLAAEQVVAERRRPIRDRHVDLLGGVLDVLRPPGLVGQLADVAGKHDHGDADDDHQQHDQRAAEQDLPLHSKIGKPTDEAAHSVSSMGSFSGRGSPSLGPPSIRVMASMFSMVTSRPGSISITAPSQPGGRGASASGGAS
jgi:hypothetical protein